MVLPKLMAAPAGVPPVFVESIVTVEAKIELPVTVIAPPLVVTLAPKEFPKEPAPIPAVPFKVIAPVLIKAVGMLIP
jgi:hypothetical protein